MTREFDAVVKAFCELRKFDLSQSASVGQCYVRSVAFAQWLRDRPDLPEPKLVHLRCPKKRIPKDAAPHWHKWWSKASHFVIRVRRTYVDLSGAQFGATYKKLYWSKRELIERWECMFEGPVY